MNNLLDRRIDLSLDSLVLSAEIEEGDGHFGEEVPHFARLWRATRGKEETKESKESKEAAIVYSDFQ